MKSTDKAIFVVTSAIIFCWMIYLVKSVLTPFICSLIIAYFLDPMVDYLHLKCKVKMSRLTATSLILGLFLVSVIVAAFILLPIIYNQSVALFDALPGYFQTIANDFYPKFAQIMNEFGFKLETNFFQLLEDQKINARLVELSQNIFDNALSSSITIINVLSLIFITPILVFYLLKDWDILIEKVSAYLPKGISSSAKKVAADIDKSLSGYIRGQFHVCFILGIIYSVLLSFVGLNFGFLIGFLTGIFSFIPYIGAGCGFAVAIVFSFLQWGFHPGHIMAVAAVFIFGQLIESNFLTPKLIGSKIGLHPVWVIFGLFIFGVLFGFVGLVAAVPLTATCGVIIKHFALEYKKRFT
jgi:predicted PurR-regulated permease PerM